MGLGQKWALFGWVVSLPFNLLAVPKSVANSKGANFNNHV